MRTTEPLRNFIYETIVLGKWSTKGICFLGFFMYSLCAFAQDFSYVAQTGHSKQITSLSLSNNERYMISGSLDETIVSWGLSNQMQVGTVLGLRGGVRPFLR